MLKKILKWTSLAIVSLVLLVLLWYVKVYWNTNRKLNKIYDVKTETIQIPDDSASYLTGEHLVKIKGCTDCHGADLSGKILIDNSPLGRIVASNITTGKGGLPQDFDTNDWVRAIRHGINRDGKTLLFMPAPEFNALTENDLGSLILYCRKQPPVDHELPDNKLLPLARILADLDKLPLIVAEKIDHDKPIVHHIEETVGPAFGEYLATACTGCHRSDFKGGGPIAPGFPPVPNISASGIAGQWTELQFIQMLRTGITPEGRQIDEKNMPWTMTKQYSDTELKALYVFLKTQS